MAQKRMFDRAIIDTDKFMDLPVSGKALYFLLGMEADDEGFVSPRKVLRVHGGTDDDVKVLIAKGFLIPFESGVVVITDWNKNNWLDSRRVRSTEYKREREMLALTEDHTYVLSARLADVKLVQRSIEEKSIEEKKNKHGDLKNVSLSTEEYEKLTTRYGRSAINSLIGELSTYMASSGKKYKDHYATLLNWAKRKGVVEVPPPTKAVEEVAFTPEQLAANQRRIAEVRQALTARFKN
jgi:hypothetical protein